MKALTDPLEIKQAQRLLAETWITESNGELFKNISLGQKYGSETFNINYIGDHNVWASLSNYTPEKVWNAFGLGKPEVAGPTSVVCEINFSLDGSPTTSGILGINTAGEKFILYKGEDHVPDFWNRYTGEPYMVDDQKYARIAKLDAYTLVKDIVSFLHELERIRQTGV